MSSSYGRQDRGDKDAYAAYFAGMDRTAQQKVALTTAHFPTRGKVADMGCGSGLTTFDLANLYVGLELVGVDVNPKSVAHAEETHRRINLRYLTGDIADKLFADGELTGILNSSVLHHVTSFNGFRTDRVRELLDNQVAELAAGGVLIIRDFVVPRGPHEVDLEVKTEDGTAKLFEAFAQNFRSSQNRDGAVPYERLPSRRDGFVRFRLTLRAATEFVLRKDYRDHWDAELLEEYTYYSQEEFEREFERRGLRISVSTEIHNPWIVTNRFRDQIFLSETSGVPLPYPPTNFLIVGKKVPSDRGVRLAEVARRPEKDAQFLRLERERHTETGYIYELVHRPHRTIDVLPYFEQHDRLFVLARSGFPRPIPNVRSDEPDLLNARGAGWVTEPISAIVDETPGADDAIIHMLEKRAALSRADILEIGERQSFFTSPGGINERVDAHLVSVVPWSLERDHEISNYSSFRSSGSIRPFDASQLLRASHVGGMYDSRLEIGVYRLLRKLGRAWGPWIGADVDLELRDTPGDIIPAEVAFVPPERRRFETMERAPARFLELRRGVFVESNRAGDELARTELEYVLPRSLSRATVVALPVVRTRDHILIGVEERDLPAVERHTGSAAITVIPAARLPRHVHTFDEAAQFARNQLEEQFALRSTACFPLGGRYFPSVGITPEVVYPFAIDVDARRAHNLLWIDLRDALRNMHRIADAHSLTMISRLVHALGVSELS